MPSFDELASVTALLGGSSFVSQSKQHAVIILFSLFAHSTEFFPARDQVLEQCLCDCHCGNLSTQYSAQLWPSLRGTLCNHREAQLCSQPPPQPADAGSHDLRLRREAEVGVSGGPESTRRWNGPLCAGAAGTERQHRTVSRARRLVGKSCWVRGEFFPAFLRRASGLVSEASSLFLSVEAYGNDVSLIAQCRQPGISPQGLHPKEVQLPSTPPFCRRSHAPDIHPFVHYDLFCIIISSVRASS